METTATTRLVIDGKILRKKRLEAVLTPEQLGAKVGLSGGTIYHFEGGQNSTTPRTAQALAKVFKCPVTDFTYVREVSA